MTVPSSVLELVERFQRDITAYKSPSYNETQTRQEFIDPLFEALGWDIGNRGGAAAAFREVVLEYSMKIGAATKAPDYLFQLGGTPRFFVEAKKPSVNIKDDTSPAFQLRRYAWSATLPLSVLTDFEEFVVYDCRVEPDKADKPTVARMFYIPYTEYAAKWDTIAELFSREAVLGGSLEKFAQEQKAPKGATAVDVAFLREIESWRELLAKNVAIWNPELSQRELNYAVQMTLDRLIFLRICEDRGIEPYGKLQRLQKGGQVYKQLVQQFRDADDRYNSGLFHFAKEKGREGPDALTPGLYIDDEPLKKIVRGLYYPDSPYEFSVLPVEILGNVYEQFLGKVIHLTSKHEAVVEEKPEVRRAGGVFYTPAYIVDYIIKNTVGKLLVGKTPKEAAKLRILDPACGSGSFLLGAYQYLLDWYLAQYYAAGPAKHKKELYQGPRGEWKLTSAARKRILLDNIYGVDIDAQAVEVTKLSLSLKVLEGESEQTIGTTRSMFQERALPDLVNNIKCGNSLVQSDFYESEQATFLSQEEQEQINVFDWKIEFANIMHSGGFDAIIGNPPYVRMETFVSLKDYLRRKYFVYDERTDLYAYVIEASLKLLHSRGLFSMIVSNKFVKTNYGKKLRCHIRSVAGIEQIVDFAGTPVFKGATVRTLILNLQKGGDNQNPIQYSPPPSVEEFYQILSGGITVSTFASTHSYSIDPSRWKDDEWAFERSELQTIREKLEVQSVPLSKWLDVPICYGVKSGLVDAFVLSLDVAERLRLSSDECAQMVRPYVIGREVLRYGPINRHSDIIYTPRGVDMAGCEAILEYLTPFKERLLNRATKQEWYELQQAQERYVGLMSSPKIIYPDIAKSCRFTLDEGGHICGDTTFAIPVADKVLLGLLNSRVALFYFQSVCAALEGAEESYLRFKLQYVANFPVPAGLTTRTNQIEPLVERMLDLNKRLAATKTSQDRTVLQRQIEGTDRQIDKLVYELYELSDEEIAIVEGATK